MRSVVIVVALVACRSAEKASSAPPNLPDDLKARKDTVLGGSGSGFGNSTGSLPDNVKELITPGDLTATGDIDKDVVRHVVKQNLQKLQLCYEKTLLANPGISGRVVVTFTIAIEGSVSDVTATGIHPDVETCIATEFRTFKFPSPSSKTQVEYPFTFRPG